MKKIILFLSFLSVSLANAGVSADTIIRTIEGPREIGSIREGDMVVSFDDQLKECSSLVENIEFKTFNNIIEIITADDVIIRVAPEQKFFSFCKWINAEDLSLNDVLFTKDKSWIRIKSIRHLQEEEIFCFIEVKDNHNFLATINGVLVHNGINGALIGAIVGEYIGKGIGMSAMGILSAPAMADGFDAFTAAWAENNKTAALYIENTSRVTGIAGGIIGGVATGVF